MLIVKSFTIGYKECFQNISTFSRFLNSQRIVRHIVRWLLTLIPFISLPLRVWTTRIYRWRSTSKLNYCGFKSFTMHPYEPKRKQIHWFSLYSFCRGKVLLIVNVASQCGLTNANYTQLKEILDKYKSQGFEVAAFPCNQFQGQVRSCFGINLELTANFL